MAGIKIHAANMGQSSLKPSGNEGIVSITSDDMSMHAAAGCIVKIPEEDKELRTKLKIGSNFDQTQYFVFMPAIIASQVSGCSVEIGITVRRDYSGRGDKKFTIHVNNQDLIDLQNGAVLLPCHDQLEKSRQRNYVKFLYVITPDAPKELYKLYPKVTGIENAYYDGNMKLVFKDINITESTNEPGTFFIDGESIKHLKDVGPLLDEKRERVLGHYKVLAAADKLQIFWLLKDGAYCVNINDDKKQIHVPQKTQGSSTDTTHGASSGVNGQTQPASATDTTQGASSGVNGQTQPASTTDTTQGASSGVNGQTQPASTTNTTQGASSGVNGHTQPASTTDTTQLVSGLTTLTVSQADGSVERAADPRAALVSDILKDRAILQKVEHHLDRQHRFVHNWEFVASELKVPPLERAKFKSNTKHSPTEDLLIYVEEKLVNELISALLSICRKDIVLMIRRRIPVINDDDKIRDKILSNIDLVEDMGAELDLQSGAKNWKNLGHKIGVKREKLEDLERGNDPAFLLIEYMYSTIPAATLTIQKFDDVVSAIGNNAVHVKFEKGGALSPDNIEKPMKEVIPLEGDLMSDICRSLNKAKGNAFKFWEHLASKMDIDRTVYSQFNPESPQGPTRMFLQWLCGAYPEFTITQFCKVLVKIKRFDVIEILEKWARDMNKGIVR